MVRLKNLCFGIWTTLHFEIWTGPYFKSGPFYTKCAQYGPLLQIILKHVFGPQFEELINWTGPFFTKIWSIHFAQNVDMIIWTTWCNMDRSMFQKLEVVHIPKVFGPHPFLLNFNELLPTQRAGALRTKNNSHSESLYSWEPKLTPLQQ